MNDESTRSAPDEAAAVSSGAGKRKAAAVSRADIIEAAQRLVDDAGLEALTMRRLARAVGISVNTVYATAGDKDAILQGMVNSLLDHAPSLDRASVDPEAELITFFDYIREVFVAHPAIGHLAAVRAVYGPAVFRGLHTVLGLLGRLGIDDDTAVDTCQTLISYTIGFSLHQSPRRSPEAVAAQRGRLLSLLPDTDPNSDLVYRWIGAPRRADQFAASLHLILRGARR